MSFKYTSILIGAQLVLWVIVVLLSFLLSEDGVREVLMVPFILYYPFVTVARAFGVQGVGPQFITGAAVGVPVYALALGALLKRMKERKRFS